MTSEQVCARVTAALEKEPSLASARIDVTVDRGVVTLSGEVGSFARKALARRLAFGIEGVTAVADELTVRLQHPSSGSDSEGARTVWEALRWHPAVPAGQISVRVAQGQVTLWGDVDWPYQRDAAEETVRALPGVVDVINEIRVRPPGSVTDVEAKILAALRAGTQPAQRIRATARGSTIVLAGTVRSWTEREDAERAARSAPGVRTVEDHIVVVP
jgi:osmotically-inducible protein OsmY